ncbi:MULTISPECIES: CoxG family protein [Bacillus]|uniref:CoxG family protein n=1 Tax=Bacillus TaxID=1386 RepID=UPI00094D9AB6|nr:MULTISPECIES: SRPBCC family protein [Bacillus]MEC0899131.1 SRPBCC family protein [Bacillus anthracis]
MAKGIHTIELNASPNQIWKFISDINNWAPLVAGYVKHKIIDDKHSTWRLHGDLGFIKRDVSLNVEIIEWQTPDKISFTMTSPTKKLVGSGFFLAESTSPSTTKVTSQLELRTTGKGAFVFNSAIKPFVPKMTKQLSKKVADKLMKQL